MLHGLLLSHLDYHPLWSVELNKTIFVSDPTTESTPVGVDFYEIGEQGKEHSVLHEKISHPFLHFHELFPTLKQANSMVLLVYYIQCKIHPVEDTFTALIPEEPSGKKILRVLEFILVLNISSCIK